VAILLVMANHDSRLLGGFVGVDIFFALSGFLITSLLVEEWRQSGSIDLPRFYARRFLRLAPALCAFVLVVYVATHWIVPGMAEAALRGRWAVAALLYFTNVVIAFGGEYPLGFVSTCWSLALEEQFYLLWPLVLRTALRRGISWPSLAGLLAAVIAACNVQRLALASHPRDGLWLRIYCGPDTRADAILVGCLLAVILAWRGAPRPAPPLRTAISLLAAVAALGFAARHGIPGVVAAPWLFAVIGAASTVLVLHTAGDGRVARMLAWPPMVWIGRLSYSLYLWHPVGFELASGLGGWLGYATVGTLAATSYFFVEVPFLALKRRLAAPATGAEARP
jgi:peptidoglycan/LPS O-acetylase OafA/YrhL